LVCIADANQTGNGLVWIGDAHQTGDDLVWVDYAHQAGDKVLVAPCHHSHSLRLFQQAVDPTHIQSNHLYNCVPIEQVKR